MVGRAADPAGWLNDPASLGLGPEELIAELAGRLVASGVPLLRLMTSLHTAHPEVWVRDISWSRGAGLAVVEIPHELARSARYSDSPIAPIHAGGPAVRCRLEPPDPDLRYPICRDLAAQGATDYLVLPLPFTSGPPSYLSLATDRPAGFRDEDLARFAESAPALALRLELASAYHATRSLLAVYLGPNAARRVLDGAFQRGAGESLRAVIWMSDMRGFTRMADSHPARETVVLLNRTFECLADPIADHGGEVLKFIGDAVLAIFPCGEQGEAEAGRSALAACEAALARVDELGAERRAGGQPAVSVGVGLHLGDVLYGNIGARTRLDFTVIGAAVNEVARVEALTKELGVPLLLTSELAGACRNAPLFSLGHHELRGVSAPRELFTLARFVRG